MLSRNENQGNCSQECFKQWKFKWIIASGKGNCRKISEFDYLPNENDCEYIGQPGDYKRYSYKYNGQINKL